MSTAPPTASETPINKQITNDLKVAFKTILEKYLGGRTIKEDKIKSWMNNILTDAKEYFIKLTGMIEEMMKFEKIQEIPENIIKTFGETLLTTPELNSQINKLVLKKFE